MRVVFDTNVLFSAFTVHGACAGLYEECIGKAEMIVSPAILDELEQKLFIKAKVSKAEVKEVLNAVRKDTRIFDALRLPKPVCRDADDDKILAVALSAKADAIVTGDKDLLVLGKFEGIPIFNPRICLAFLAGG